MGRANVYLPDDLERRVKAARIPVSEVCQQALLAAVEAAEAQRPRLGEAVGDLYRRGAQAGERWARAASSLTLLALVRDQRVDPIPADHLPEAWYSLSEELTTAWEAGFVEAARAVARGVVSDALVSTSDPSPASAPSAPVGAAASTASTASTAGAAGAGPEGAGLEAPTTAARAAARAASTKPASHAVVSSSLREYHDSGSRSGGIRYRRWSRRRASRVTAAAPRAQPSPASRPRA